jgi:uncharacterized protein
VIPAITDDLSAGQIIAMLGLQPHPEGGHFRETFRDNATDGNGRAASTLIYFLLALGEHSAWHRVDAVEIWHYYAGAPLQLLISNDGKTTQAIQLGAQLASGERPQAVVPAHAWQAAKSTGAWTLVGCTVAPGFSFDGFEMAAADWQPG